MNTSEFIAKWIGVGTVYDVVRADFNSAIAAAVAAERERIIAKIPGGLSVDPQWVCDMIRGIE